MSIVKPAHSLLLVLFSLFAPGCGGASNDAEAAPRSYEYLLQVEQKLDEGTGQEKKDDKNAVKDDKNAVNDNGAPKPDSQASNTKTPIDASDDLKSKVTFATYLTADDRLYDINLRRQFGAFVGWIGGLLHPGNASEARIGLEYDYQYSWVFLKPSVEVGSRGGVMGYMYSELGKQNYAIVAVSRTDNRPLQDFFFDPNDSLELGAGRKLNDYDRISLSTTFDIRFHTGQQNTHLTWRHKLNAKNGITLDGLFKSGHTDYDKYIRAFGLGIYYDRPTWFWKFYYDPHVNYTQPAMLRAGVGLKF